MKHLSARPASSLIVCISLLGMALSLPLFAQAPPSQDTFVSSATPKINYGPGFSIAVGPGTTSYLQFNLSGIPAGATISKASLRLYVDGVIAKGSFDVYQLNSGWNENTLTYNTPPPALGASATAGHPVAVTAASMNQFILIDITPLAQAWVNGTTANNGVALALTTAAGSFSFDSKESLLTANGPQLLLSFVTQGPQGPQGPAGPQGIQGPQGAQGAPGPAGAQGLPGTPGIDGAQGAQGPAGATGAGFTFRGPFSGDPIYAINDVVTYLGSTYVATAANQGADTPDVNPNIWSIMAQAGAAGQQGPAGPQGPQGVQGDRGLSGLPGLTGATGATGPQGPQGLQGLTGPPGPAGPGGFNGMQEFTNPMPGTSTQVPLAPYQWTVPPGVTRVMVEMWGAGGGGGALGVETTGGGGGGYARSFVPVTPGATYDIFVGGGGASGQDGGVSSLQFGGQTLVLAGGGSPAGIGGAATTAPGQPSIVRRGGFTLGPAGAAAADANVCPGPDGALTGSGASFGDPTSHAYGGYVLITW